MIKNRGRGRGRQQRPKDAACFWAPQKRLDLTDLRPEDMARTRFGAEDCGAANAARRIY